jgi:hypothetical protein
MRLKWLLLFIVLASIFLIYRRSQSVNTISTMIPDWEDYLLEREESYVKDMKFSLPSGMPIYAPEHVNVDFIGFKGNSTYIVLKSQRKEFRLRIGGNNVGLSVGEWLEKGERIGIVEDFEVHPDHPNVNMMLTIRER